MKLNSIQIAGLKALAAVPARPDPLSMVEDRGLLPMAQSAYSLGMIDGRAQLARELLQEWEHGAAQRDREDEIRRQRWPRL